MKKHSMVIDGRKTSVSLENEFYDALKQIASNRRQTIGEVVAQIQTERDGANTSSAIRLFVLAHYQSRATP